ncbi:molecular chaperone EcpD, partial [Methylobacterium radiotolerans]
MHTGEPMPQDKESVFWLNVLEIPPKDKANQNLLQMAFRSRIKLFYRPAGLKGKAEDAPSQ